MTVKTDHDIANELLKSTHTPLLEIRNLKVHFPVKEGFIIQRQVGTVKAVDGVNLIVHPGETLGLLERAVQGKLRSVEQY